MFLKMYKTYRTGKMLQCNKSSVYYTHYGLIPTYLRRFTMFTFDEQYKKYEELLDRTKQAYEFWVNCLTSTWEDFYKAKKK